MDVANNLLCFLKKDDIQQIPKKDLLARIIEEVFGVPSNNINLFIDTTSCVLNFPTYIFLKKFERYLLGTLCNFEEQCKLAGKLDPKSNTKNYQKLTEELILTIDKIESLDKILYFSSLTRALLLLDMEIELFWKLKYYIMNCTIGELKFLEDLPMNYKGRLNTKISILYRYGLFQQVFIESDHDTMYEISDFGKALKSNCLNFDDEQTALKTGKTLIKYDDLSPLEMLEPMSYSDIEGV